LYILNEKEYIREVLVSKHKPNDLTMGYFITLIAKYYCSDDLGYEKLCDIVKETLLEFNLENYQEYKYHNKIVSVCKNITNGTLEKDFKEREFIPIYENELNVINSLKTDRQKKIMFTFIAVARYMDSEGWINKKTSKGLSEIFKLANVSLTTEKRDELLHELYVDGYISFGKKVDNLNIRVKLDDSGDVIYKVKNFDNLGNQYIGNFKKGYRQCANPECGRKIKIASTTGRPKLYCNECAKKIEAENAILRKRKQREIGKCHEKLNLENT
jgi:hypothetical protein